MKNIFVLMIIVVFFISIPNDIFAENNNNTSTSNLTDNVIENTTELLITIAGFSGVLGLFWGIYQYRQTRIEKRKDTLLQLADKFDNDKRLVYAKKILDCFNLRFLQSWKKDLIEELGEEGYEKLEDELDKEFQNTGKRRYHISNSEKIMIPHTVNAIDDIGIVKIRESFDSLFDFFDRLAYLYKLKLIKDAELYHFMYFINKARENEYIKKFVESYEYNWIKDFSKI